MLVSLHQECLQGNFSRIQQLHQRLNSGIPSLASSLHETVRVAHLCFHMHCILKTLQVCSMVWNGTYV